MAAVEVAITMGDHFDLDACRIKWKNSKV